LRFVHLVGAEAEVCKDDVGPPIEVGQVVGDSDEIVTDRLERGPGAMKPVGGDRQRAGIHVEADDGAGRSQRPGQQRGVTALADRAVHHHLAGLRGEQAKRFGRQHWLVTAINHGCHDIAAAMAVFGNNVAGGFNVLYRTLLSVLVVVVSSGCTRWRFVVEAVPADDKLTETVVLRDPGAGTSSAKIALIDVKGMIVNAQRGRIMGRIENPVARFTESLRRAEEDSKVKAVIIRVNSPGGTVTASDIMYREVLDFKKRSSKPVVILMDEVAASGGYYLSCAGDEIIAYPTTVTGSIGVIIQTFNFSGGMAKIGIKADAITSGPNKAVGSPFEPMSREHRALLQEIVDEFYGNFVDVVVENRPMVSTDDLERITDGRVMTGARAVEVGLVDRLGDLRTAFAASKRRANLARARLVKYHRPLEYVGSPYATAPAVPAGSQVNLIQLNLPSWPYQNTGFYYLWDPTAW